VGIANETVDAGLLEKMAEEWGRDPDELRCGGCKSDITAVFCTDCEMRVYARIMEKRSSTPFLRRRNWKPDRVFRACPNFLHVPLLCLTQC